MTVEKTGPVSVWLGISIAAIFSLTIPLFSARAASVEEVSMMKSAERQKLLVEGAKKEGKVTWYTTLIVDQVVRPIKEAFEKEYPFVQLEYYRGNSENVVQRVISEYQAKRFAVDIVDGSSSPTMLRRAGLMQRFFSPYLSEYPPELKDAQGFWGVANLYFFAIGYNTRMVKASEVPKTYEDLLNPRWKGQMMWSTARGAGAPLFIGSILQTMGRNPARPTCKNSKRKTSPRRRQAIGRCSIWSSPASFPSACKFLPKQWGNGYVVLLLRLVRITSAKICKPMGNSPAMTRSSTCRLLAVVLAMFCVLSFCR